MYVFVNIAMVMGLIPVGGVPLPLVSHGGSAMITVMLGFGLLMSVDRAPRRGVSGGAGEWIGGGGALDSACVPDAGRARRGLRAVYSANAVLFRLRIDIIMKSCW